MFNVYLQIFLSRALEPGFLMAILDSKGTSSHSVMKWYRSSMTVVFCFKSCTYMYVQYQRNVHTLFQSSSLMNMTTTCYSWITHFLILYSVTSDNVKCRSVYILFHSDKWCTFIMNWTTFYIYRGVLHRTSYQYWWLDWQEADWNWCKGAMENQIQGMANNWGFIVLNQILSLSLHCFDWLGVFFFFQNALQSKPHIRELDRPNLNLACQVRFFLLSYMFTIYKSYRKILNLSEVNVGHIL